MPGNVPPVADERDGLLAYLAQQRYVLQLTAYGLTDEQARAVPTVSVLSIGGLIKHVTAVEHAWMDTVQQRRQGTVKDFEANFRLGDDETLADVLTSNDDAARRSGAVIADIADLGQLVGG